MSKSCMIVEFSKKNYYLCPQLITHFKAMKNTEVSTLQIHYLSPKQRIVIN